MRNNMREYSGEDIRTAWEILETYRRFGAGAPARALYACRDWLTKDGFADVVEILRDYYLISYDEARAGVRETGSQSDSDEHAETLLSLGISEKMHRCAVEPTP